MELRIPNEIGEGVTHDEACRDLDAAVGGYGKQRRSLHLDAQDTGGLVMTKFLDGLTVWGVDGPGAAGGVLDIAALELADQAGGEVGSGKGELARREVVMRYALIPTARSQTIV